MLIDKGYYDYDYEKPKEKPKKLTAEQKRMWSDAEVAAVLGRAINPATGKPIFEQQSKPLTPDEMQRIAMQEAREKKNKQ